MIVGYRDKKTERFANGEHVKEFSGFARQVETRLDRLDAATKLKDLAAMSGNRLEALKGNRKGNTASASMINGGFVSSGPKGSTGPINVEIVDYH